jgi:hypothetical protein
VASLALGATCCMKSQRDRCDWQAYLVLHQHTEGDLLFVVWMHTDGQVRLLRHRMAGVGLRDARMCWCCCVNTPLQEAFDIFELLPVLLLGVIGGLLGSCFTYLNEALADWRKRGVLCCCRAAGAEVCPGPSSLLLAGLPCEVVAVHRGIAEPCTGTVGPSTLRDSQQQAGVRLMLAQSPDACCAWFGVLRCAVQCCCHTAREAAYGRRLQQHC